MNIKVIEKTDIPFLVRLMNAREIKSSIHIGDTDEKYWYDAYELWAADRYEISFIIRKGETPVGWMKLNCPDNTDTAWISMLVILPEYQRQGIGSFAVSYAEDYFAGRGFSRIGIHTTKDNEAAQRCYTKLGFTITGIGECTNADGQKRTGYTFSKCPETDETAAAAAHWYAFIYDKEETRTEDVDLLLSLIGKEPKRVFEACCGSGRILVPLAEAGHSAVGLDINAGMLARIPDKAKKLDNLSCFMEDAVKADWGHGYDIAVLAGNILINIETGMEYAGAQQLFIKKASECLRSGGHLFLDFNLFLRPERFFGRDSERVIFQGEDDRGVYGRYIISGGRYDPQTHITECDSRTELTLPGGRQIIIKGRARKHIPSLEQVHFWLSEYGFAVLEEYGDYSKNPISESTCRAVIWARKEET